MIKMLKVVEIFRSIQGETSFAGVPFVFVRLAGCNLKCTWCDTKYARDSNGEEYSTDAILKKVRDFRLRNVMITGGEPLIQPAVYDLMEMFLDSAHNVLLETNGSISCRKVPREVIKIMDFKCPSSGMQDVNLFENIDYLTPRDEVNFVIACDVDYGWTADVVRKFSLYKKCRITLTPAHGLVEPSWLAEKIYKDALPVVFQLQLHKLIWPGNPRGK